jgi:opacity protein-like surface antigen
MVGLRLGLCTLAAACSLAATAARAADYPQPPIYMPPVIEEYSSWYLRGDIGFSNQQVGSLFNDNYAGFASVQNINESFDAAPIFGIGIGFNVNSWLRLDLTGEYRGAANFHGLDVGNIGRGAYADDRYTGSNSEWTFLFNGYFDLGTWNRLTPFIGAGIGASRTTISNFGDTSVCVNSSSCAGFGGSAASAVAQQGVVHV